MEKPRIIVFIVLTVLGVGLLAYGLQSRAAVVSTGEPGQVAANSELAITQAVARGGITRDDSGQVKTTPQASSGEAPAACPT